MDQQKQLTERFWTVLICVLVAAVVLSAAISTRLIRDQQFGQRFDSIHQRNIAEAGKNFEVLRQHALLVAQLVARSTEVRQLLSQAQLHKNAKPQESELAQVKTDLLQTLDVFMPTLQSVGGQQLQIYVAPEGTSLQRDHNQISLGEDASEVQLVQQVMAAKKAQFQFIEGLSGVVMLVAAPVFANDDLIGVIEFNVALESLSKDLQSAAVLPQSAFVIRLKAESHKADSTHGKNLVNHGSWQSEVPLLNQSGLLAKLPERIDTTSFQLVKVQQKYFLVSLIPQSLTQNISQRADVAILSWVDVTDAIELKTNNDQKVTGIWLITLAVGVALVYWLSRQLRSTATAHLRQQMEELKWSQQKLLALFELSPDAILLNRLADGNYLDANPAMTLMTGYTLAELKKLSYWDLTPADYEKQEQEQLRLLNETGKYGPYRKQYRHKNGELIDIELRGVLFNSPVGEPLIWSVITDRRESLKVERMKQDFISNISHELRTPLTSISGSLDLLVAGATGELPAKAQKLLQIAIKNNKRLINLVNDLLDIEKLSLGKLQLKPEEILSKQILHSAFEVNQPYTQMQQVKLELGHCDDFIVVVDPQRIQQVFSNLISNAAKFSPAHSVVTLSCKKRQQMMRFEVVDQGPGLTGTEIARLFQRFSQLDHTAAHTLQGSGLGLSICKEIIEQSHGQIGVVSVPKSGSTFWFELPLKEQFSPTASKILIIEDDPDTALTLQALLQTKHYITEIAHNLTAAWAILESQSFDLITLDLRLEQENGCDFFLKLRDRKEYSDLPVLVVSAFAEHGKLQLNAIANTIDWLEKPVHVEDLVFKIENLLSRRNAQRFSARILHVEDDEDIVSIIRMQLESKYYYHHAGNLAQARDKIRCNRYDLILLDIGLPDGEGWQLLSDLHGVNENVPIIVFSALDITVQQKHQAAAVFGKTKVTPQNLVTHIEQILHT